MAIGSISTAVPSLPSSNGPGGLKKSFEDLGAALDSGDISAAQNALTKLEKTAPPQAKQSNNPIADDLSKLSDALQSGDLDAAKQAYSDIKDQLAQPPKGFGGGPPGGAPPAGGRGGPGGAGGADDSSKTSQVYDPKDTNQDGKVSIQEELIYELGQIQGGSSDSLIAPNSQNEANTFDTYA